MPAAALAGRRTVHIRYEPRGAAVRLFESRDPELLIAGPAGTGKSRAALEKTNLLAGRYPGMRALLVRTRHEWLKATTLVTFDQQVIHAEDGISFFGGSARYPAAYHYPNSSTIVVGGLDQASKVMGSEYDLILASEATDFTEAEIETLTTRLRHGVMPYQQLLMDCNPGPPQHPLRLRCERGQTTLLDSRHEDNPRLYADGVWTEYGAAYIARLDRLTGHRYQRLRLGRWAAAEGMVYEAWDTAVHVITGFEIPAAWPRYWGVDFGYTNAFVLHAYAEDPDGRLYLYRELYQTRRLVEDHARTWAALCGADVDNAGRVHWGAAAEPRPRAIYCDHDAEGRATLERVLGMRTTPAYKAVSAGIQAVEARLRSAGDGLPRLYVFRDALVERDPALADAGKPTGLAQEMDAYVWDISAGRRTGEEPVKEDDHAEDTLRYVVAGVDRIERAHAPSQGRLQPRTAGRRGAGAAWVNGGR